MANRKYELEDLAPKTSDDGSSDAGRLTHEEWNSLIDIVSEVKGNAQGAIKGIIWKPDAQGKGAEFTEVDSRGYLKLSPVDPQGEVSIFVTEKPKDYISSDSSCKVSYYVSSKVTSNGQSVSAPVPCKISYYISNDGEKDILVGSDSVYDFESTLPGVKKTAEFDFASIKNVSLGSGIDNKLTILIDNGYGKTITEYFIVRVINLKMTVSGFDTNSVYNETNKPELRVTVYGSDAKVYAEVNGTRILDGGNTSDGVLETFDSSIFDSVNVHGVYRIKIWASVSIDLGNNETETISTNPVEYDYIYGGAAEDPIVMANIANKTPEQYTNFNVSYIAYKYNSTNSILKEEVRTSIYEYKEVDGEKTLGRELVYTTQNVEFNNSTNSAEGSSTLSLFPVSVKKNNSDDYETVNLIGPMAIVISIGDYKYIDYINIKESSIKLSEVPGYAVKLSSAGRSNNETTTLKQWISNGKAGEVSMSFDDNVEFTDTGSGWIFDGDRFDTTDPNDKGNVALRLRKGRYCTLNYNPFNTNPTYNSQNNAGTGRGMTISIEFATRNSLNQEASVISCMENDALGIPKGFEVLANKATIYSDNVQLYADFKEDTRIKLDFVIDDKKYKYTTEGFYYLDENEEKQWQEGETTEEALCIIYVDGVYQALATIPAGTSFQQSSTGVPIRFGSDECDLDIYNIRIYDTPLTPMQIVQNYAYDTPNVKNKLAIASRNNNVLEINPETPQKPNINIEGLRVARPALPFFFVEMDDTEDPSETLPQDKSAWKLMKWTQFQNPSNESNLVDGAPSFEVKYGVMKNQGTSSMTYPWPWRNWDWKTKDDDFASYNPDGKFYMPTFDEPVHTESYWPQYKGMQNISSGDGKGNLKKITLKKDYASSEMCNNAITSEMFTDMALGIADAVPGALSPAQRTSGAKNSQYRLTFKATPCFMFRRYSDSTKKGSAGTGVEALGMMNLIPNKNECAYLGFFGNYKWEKNRSQSWELSDNYPEKFWVEKLEGVKYLSSKEHTNDIDGLYEARYPKDTTVFTDDNGEFDGDFGMTKGNITKDQAANVFKEQKDLVEFHNWLVDTNRQVAINYKNENGEYRKLSTGEANQTWNQDETGKLITEFDDPDYRLRKFKAEAPTRMLVDQFALYYVWRETFWAYDSGFKNLQIYTMGKADENLDYMQWGCMVRDADTTLGIQNQGRIEFPPYLEDTDYYIEENGVKTYYFDALKNSYDESDINAVKGKHVLNGQLGSLWLNIRDAFADRIETVYTKLRENSNSTNWTAAKAIKRFRDHQEKWCESLYNFGMRQYFGGAQFTKWISSGLGDKKNSRAAWLEKAFYYRDSKYKVLSDYAAIRASTYESPDQNVPANKTANIPLKFKLYQPVWLGLGANEQSMKSVKTHRRISDVSDYIDVTAAELQLPEGFNSAVNWHYGTDNMVEIGDLARVCKIHDVQGWKFPKLKALLLGKDPDRGGDGVTYYEYVTDTATNEKTARPIINDDLKSLDLSSMKQLQVLDITNHKKVGNINATYCTELREIYARGCTSTASIELPNTTTLSKIYFPSSITSIDITGLRGITKFVLDAPVAGEDYAIRRLYIDDCGDYMAAESYKIVEQVINNLERAYNPESSNSVCTLTNVKWDNADSDMLERLLNINATLSGDVTVTSLSNDIKVRLINKYGNIDDPKNSLRIKYNQEQITSVSMMKKIYAYENKDYQLVFNVIPSYANTYSSATWTLDANATPYATIDSKTGLLKRNNVPADDTVPGSKLTVVIEQIPYSNGDPRPTITRESTVYFYERLARPGDIVFHDGTFGDEKDPSKTAVGVCFYVDPNDKNKRLMTALAPVYASTSKTFAWGVNGGIRYPASSSSSGYAYNGPSPDLKINNIPYSYDLREIDNINRSGVTGIDITSNPNYYTDEIFRNSNEPNNKYFKSFDSDTYYGDLGWRTIVPGDFSEIRIDNVGDGNQTIEIKTNDEVPIGYYKTLAMIYNRNRLLDAYRNVYDQQGAFERPKSSANDTEITNLGKLINRADSWNYETWTIEDGGNTYGSCLYYPAASVCFAYEPTGISNLNDKFKKYNWFLPSSGELARLLYYIYQSQGLDDVPLDSTYTIGAFKDAAANAFDNAMKEKIISKNEFINKEYYSSTETSEKEAVDINPKTGSCGASIKAHNNSVIPVCRF